MKKKKTQGSQASGPTGLSRLQPTHGGRNSPDEGAGDGREGTLFFQPRVNPVIPEDGAEHPATGKKQGPVHKKDAKPEQTRTRDRQSALRGHILPEGIGLLQVLGHQASCPFLILVERGGAAGQQKYPGKKSEI